MREDGIVIEIMGDICRVSVKRKSACGENCASCKATCSAREHICEARDFAGAKVGDRVVLETDSKKLLKSAFLVYILPILVFLTVFMLASKRFSQGASAVFSILATAGVFILMRMYDKCHKSELLPVVTEIL